GMVFEGPSGRGKDVVVDAALTVAGFVEAKQAEGPTPAAKKYYRLTGSMNYGELETVVRKARQEGSLVVISEMNSLPSGFLEGKLNDLLTGNAAQGFGVIATMNSTDYRGRERLSSALANRVLYYRIQDYTEDELRELGRYVTRKGSNLDMEENIEYAVKAHVWLRDQIPEARLRPTSRDFLNALRLHQEDSVPIEESVAKVYGFYLRFSETKAWPDRRELLGHTVKRPIESVRNILENMANFIVPAALRPIRVRIDASDPTQSGGYYRLEQRELVMRARAFDSGDWIETLFHEGSHGMVTRGLEGALDLSLPLFQDLEDIRQENTFRYHFAHSNLSDESIAEKRFARILTRLDVNDLIAWQGARVGFLTLRDMFQYTLIAYAKGIVTEAHVQAMATVIGENLAVNPFAAAFPHLETARQAAQSIARTLDEEEVQFAQYRAAQIMGAIRQDYLAIPNEVFRKPPTEESRQEQELEATRNRLEAMTWQPQKIEIEERPGVSSKAPDPGAIKKAQQEVEAQRAKILSEMQKAVSQQLTQMEEDLQYQGGATPQRLQEIRAQLTDPDHPAALVAHLNKLNDSSFNKRVKRILTGVQQKEKAFPKKLLAEGRKTLGKILSLAVGAIAIAVVVFKISEIAPGIYQGLKSYPNAFWIAPIVGAIIVAIVVVKYFPKFALVNIQKDLQEGEDQPRGERHQVVHKEEGARSDAIIEDLAPLPPRRVEVIPVQKIVRDENIQSAAQTIEHELDGWIQDFYDTRLSPDRVYGRRGRPDVRRMMTGDINTAFVTTGGVNERTHKHLIIYGRYFKDQWTPILEEFFHFLFEQGFQLTVYLDEQRYVENITTVAQLQATFNQSDNKAYQNREEDRHLMFTDFRSRHPTERFRGFDWESLQKKVEALYAYAAFRRVAEGKWEAKPAPVPPAVPSTPTPPGAHPSGLRLDSTRLQADIDQVKQFLRDNGLDDTEGKRWKKIQNPDGSMGIDLNLGGTRVSDVSALAGLVNLQILDLEGTQVSDVSALAGLVNLQELSLGGTQVSDVSALAGLVNLQLLNLVGTQVRDVSALAGLVNLEFVDLGTTPISDRSVVYPIFENNKSPRKLRVTLQDGQNIGYIHLPSDVRARIEARQKVPAAPPAPSQAAQKALSFDDQVAHAQSILRQLGLPENRLRILRDVNVDGSPGLALDLYGSGNTIDVKELEVLKNVVGLSTGSWMRSFSFLRALPHLQTLDFIGGRREHLADLQYLPNLQEVYLEVDIFEQGKGQFYDIFDHNHAPERLTIYNRINQQTDRYTYQDYLAENHRRVAEQKARLEQFLARNEMGLVALQVVESPAGQQKLTLSINEFESEVVGRGGQLDHWDLLNGLTEIENIDIHPRFLVHLGLNVRSKIKNLRLLIYKKRNEPNDYTLEGFDHLEDVSMLEEILPVSAVAQNYETLLLQDPYLLALTGRPLKTINLFMLINNMATLERKRDAFLPAIDLLFRSHPHPEEFKIEFHGIISDVALTITYADYQRMKSIPEVSSQELSNFLEKLVDPTASMDY
ncbi:MAG: hypothetical protein NUV91_07475, partial [Candidatus Omnitrophica bacterium]|nr:hypothetical protein [Candidatus Omnitrophota bacterium]